jgi:hypothetical protein
VFFVGSWAFTPTGLSAAQVIGDDDGAEADANFVLGPSGTQS